MNFNFFGTVNLSVKSNANGNGSGVCLLEDYTDNQTLPQTPPNATASYAHQNQNSLPNNQFSVVPNQTAMANKNEVFSAGNLISQLGLNKVTETKTTVFCPSGVQVHSVVNYAPLPAQQASRVGSFMTSPGFQRSHVPSTLQTIDGLNPAVTNDGFTSLLQSQTARTNTFHAQPLNTFQDDKHHNDVSPCAESPTGNQSQPFQNKPEESEYMDDEVIACSPISIRFPDPVSNLETPSHSWTDLSLNTGNKEVPAKRKRVRRKKNEEEKECNKTEEIKKYGPYSCRLCFRVFEISQLLAVHAKTHYKNETPEEKIIRRSTKNKRKRLNLAKGSSSNGVTIPSETSQMPVGSAAKTETNGVREIPTSNTKGKGVLKEEGPILMTVEEEPVLVTLEEEPVLMTVEEYAFPVIVAKWTDSD